jgi:hypothetical protein
MGTSPDRDLEGETTRITAVKYLQGALGHATGSLLFLLVGGFIWLGGYRLLGWILVVGAFFISANGLSIWAWTELVARFTTRGRHDEGPTRTLRAQPLSTESLAEMKAGMVMTAVFVAILLVGRAGLVVFEPRTVATLFVVCLALGNVLALVWSVTRRR